jgi:hypothetical protein
VPSNEDRQKAVQKRIEELTSWLKAKGVQEPPRAQWDQNDTPEKVASNVAKDVIWAVGPGGFKQAADAHFGLVSPAMAVLQRIIRLAYSQNRWVFLVDQDWSKSRHFTGGALREVEEHLTNVEEYKKNIDSPTGG